MDNNSETISFEQAQTIIAEDLIPDINRFSFALNDIQKWSHNHLGSSHRIQKQYEKKYEESLLHSALLCRNFAAASALVYAGVSDIPYIKQERFRKRHVKEGVLGPLFTDIDCHEWSEWEPWKETQQSIVELAEDMGAPLPFIMLIKTRFSTVAAAVDSDESLVLAFEQTAIDPYKHKLVKATGIKEQRPVSMFGFPTQEHALRMEQKWQHKVSNRFFKIGKPLVEGKPSHRIWSIIHTHITTHQTTPISIDGFSRRSFIIALSKILSEHGHMPELIFKIGPTKIKLTRESSYTERQQGNFSMKLVPKEDYPIAYGEGLITRLSYFTRARWDSPEKAQERASVFLNHIKEKLITMTPFVSTDLNKNKNIRIQREDTAEPTDPQVKAKIDFLNSLLFLITTVEVLVRLYRTQHGDLFPYDDHKARTSDAFPVAIAQARSLALLLNGDISFNDFLGATEKKGYDAAQHRAFYGAVTGKSTIEHVHIMLEKLGAINNLYNERISRLPHWLPFSSAYKTSNPSGHIIEGRSRMYFDLKEGYGSGGESDEDDRPYSDSEDSELGETVVYKP